LHQGHQLVTKGPYAYIRHPMYLAVILACWGGLLLYQTWIMLVFALMMFGVVYRGYKEEEALAQYFGIQWEFYRRSVPGWIPRMRNSNKR
jgi:protein-S-isoprenylcysteine O-methyltransferase Ste14